MRKTASPHPRKKGWRLLGGAAILLLVIIGGIVFRARAFDAAALPPSLVANARLPVILPDGRRVKLRDLILSNRPTVINLWASWCGPCRREAPTFAELRDRFGSRINLIYLNVRDESASREDLARYMAEVGLPTEGYARLESDQIGRLTNAPDVLVPRTMVFDRHGLPLATITGYKPLALARVAGLVDR